MFYEPSTQTAYNSIDDFKMAYRHTSFGDLITEEERNHFGLFSVFYERPFVDGALYVTEEGPIEFKNDRWTKTTIVKERLLTREEKVEIYNIRFHQQLDTHFDTMAQSRRYDNRASVLQRAGYPGPFQKEAIAFATWMDECSVYCYKIMDQIKVGERDIPTEYDHFIKSEDFPKLEW